VRDQWHTMTRSGLSARLAAHLPEPFVEVHPEDAAQAGLVDGGFGRITTRCGSCVLKVVVTDRQRRGSLFAPIHWSDATASHARVGDLVLAETDRYSGQPEAKTTPANIASVTFSYRGFALARAPLTFPAGGWWVRVAMRNGVGALLATDDGPRIWQRCAADLFGSDAEVAEYLDEQRGRYRVAAFHDGKLVGCLFIAPAETAPQWDAVKALFERDTLTAEARRVLLSGRSIDGLVSTGPIVCACFSVGLATIRDAIASGVADVAAIGAALRAGTNCGSCLPELKRIVAETRPVAQTTVVREPA